MTKQAWKTIVARGRELVSADRGETRFELGDLALEVAPMGEGHGRTGSMETLSEYAEEIGIAIETLDVYRKVSAAWPEVIRITSASWSLHQIFMGQPDRAELIQAEWTAATARKLVQSRRPKKLGIRRDDKWWEAEKTALQHLRKWNESRLNGVSAAEAARRLELLREKIEIEERIAQELETRSYIRPL
jgi:hypothetical protein